MRIIALVSSLGIAYESVRSLLKDRFSSLGLKPTLSKNAEEVN